MSSELLTSWAEHDSFLHKVLLLATQSLQVFDEDLSKLKLERPDNAEALRQFLSADRANRLQIVVKNAEPLRRESPRLMKLLTTYPQNMIIFECPPHLASLDDAIFIADEKHALIRFHKDHARAKGIIDDVEECRPYAHRHDEILREGGEQVSATTLGL